LDQETYRVRVPGSGLLTAAERPLVLPFCRPPVAPQQHRPRN
jgi:hypothetical protein